MAPQATKNRKSFILAVLFSNYYFLTLFNTGFSSFPNKLSKNNIKLKIKQGINNPNSLNLLVIIMIGINATQIIVTIVNRIKHHLLFYHYLLHLIIVILYSF